MDISPVDIDSEAPLTDSAPVDQTEEQTSKNEIMVPKWRLDEVTTKLHEARSQKPKVDEHKNVNVEEVVQRELAPLRVKIETQEVLSNHPDFKDYAQGALNLIQKNPSLTLEDAYKLTKYDSLQSKAKEEGKNEAYQNIDKKESLQFETSGPKKASRAVTELISDRTVPLEEIRKMLPHA